jgi:Kae1-associated kinase Bud32
MAMPLKPSISSRITGGQAMLWQDEGMIHIGAEAEVRIGRWLGLPAIKKTRVPRTWRHPDLDKRLTKRRLDVECKILNKLLKENITAPRILELNKDEMTMIISKIEGSPLIESLQAGIVDENIFIQLGKIIRNFHEIGISHGDISTNNILWQAGSEPTLIDFGLSKNTIEVEDFGIDLHVLEEILSASHPEYDGAMEQVETGYLSQSPDDIIDIPAGLLPTANEVIKRLQDIRTRVRYHD